MTDNITELISYMQFIHGFIPAEIIDKKQETNNVFRFSLCPKVSFDFKSGQYLDIYIPQIQDYNVIRLYIHYVKNFKSSKYINDIVKVGGLSITSIPAAYRKTGIIKVSAKKSNDECISWLINSRNMSNITIYIRSRGKFVFREETLNTQYKTIFIGGGIGMTPLFSILCHTISMADVSPIFIYSAKSYNDFIFLKELNDKKIIGNTNVILRVTNKEEEKSLSNREDERASIGRVDYELLSRLITDAKKTFAYICGPKNMKIDISNMLKNIGVPQDFIWYEVWS